MLDFLFELLLGMPAGLGELLLEAVLELILGVVVDFASRLLSSASEALRLQPRLLRPSPMRFWEC
jgi:hypothetical protein